MIQENIHIYKREFSFSVGGAGKKLGNELVFKSIH
jgi:hypothetical protein